MVSETETKRFSGEMWTYCGRKKIGFILSDPWKYGKGSCCLPDSRYRSETKVTQEHLKHVRIMFESHNHSLDSSDVVGSNVESSSTQITGLSRGNAELSGFNSSSGMGTNVSSQ